MVIFPTTDGLCTPFNASASMASAPQYYHVQLYSQKLYKKNSILLDKPLLHITDTQVIYLEVSCMFIYKPSKGLPRIKLKSELTA